ncbi:DUF3509 domain-containing protein [Pseudomonas sp.]|uniref:DUF3509 domain-containing protein n=1 Tax=Pseudomonas sp. TaxID=306 RepID=UPI0028ADD8A7|nr:DUF3509 domain-containing protein [Pseudomonas sp.]
MESTTELLAGALAPYKVILGPDRPDGGRVMTLANEAGELIIQRALSKGQLNDRYALTDVVDGILRDLLVIEGRIAPDVIANLRGSDRVKNYAAL